MQKTKVTPEGRWLLRKEDFEKLDRTRLVEELNLPSSPNRISNVRLPQKIKMRASILGPNKWGNSSGMVQFEILEEQLDSAWFELIGDL